MAEEETPNSAPTWAVVAPFVAAVFWLVLQLLLGASLKEAVLSPLFPAMLVIGVAVIAVRSRR